MLDKKDIQKLIEVFATREELKEMISRLVTKEEFSNLQTAVDAYAKKVDAFAQEMVMLAHKVDRHEKWLHQIPEPQRRVEKRFISSIADKLGIKLEY